MNHTALVALVLVVLIAAAGCSGTRQAAAPVTTQTVTINALVPQTGALSSFGVSSRAALSVAEEDINSYYQATGSPRRVVITVQDTGSDPERALALTKALKENGSHLVIGTFSSAQLERVRPYANEKGIVVAGTEATSPALAIPGDNIIRFTADDNNLARAVPAFLASEGLTDLVPLTRGDLWGDTLENASRTAWAPRGYTVHTGTRYDPRTTDFSPVLRDLDIRTGEVAAVNGIQKTCVYAITMNEIAPLMHGAAAYQNLTKVRWMGSDPNILIPDIAQDQNASAFASAVRFTGPSIGVQRNAELGPVYEKVKSRIGRDPEGAAIQLYDLAQVAALVSAETSAMDAGQLKTALETRADTFRGVSGDCFLNEAGDRAVAIYDFYRYTGTGGMAGWMPLARYSIWPTTKIVAFQKLDPSGNVIESV